MQEPQRTTTGNTYYDLVSILYHALQEGQTCIAYIQDAQRGGHQEVAQFFSEVQREANRRAERAKSLLHQWGPIELHRGGYPGQYGQGLHSTQH